MMNNQRDTVRIGLLGCGRIARISHLATIARLPAATLSAVGDCQPENLTWAMSHAPSVRAFADYRDLLKSGEVDAVVICMPTFLHAKAAIGAFEACKHVYVEKPLASCIEDGRQVVRAWRNSGQLGMIGFNFRFHPLYLQAEHCLANGQVGRLVAAQSNFGAAPRDLPMWKRKRATGGGALLDLASHHIDMARCLVGEISRVSATIRSVRSEADTVTLSLHCDSRWGEFEEIVVQSFASMSACEADRFELIGDRGSLSVDRRAGQGTLRPARQRHDRTGRLQGLGSHLAEIPSRLAHTLRPQPEHSYQNALAHFINAIQAGEATDPDLDAGLRNLEIITAIEEAAQDGGTVSVPAVRTVYPTRTPSAGTR